METVYKTLDGKLFKQSADAAMHEKKILEQVKMWNWNEEPTTDTAQARVVHLIGENAGGIFTDMIAANEYDQVETGNMFDVGDTGWYFWDEYEETYRYIDSAIVDILIAANHQI